MSKNTNTQIQTDPKDRFFNPPPTSLPKPGPKRNRVIVVEQMIIII